METNLPLSYCNDNIVNPTTTRTKKRKINYKSVLCIGEKASFFKSELTDYEFLCIEIREVSQAISLLKKALSAEGFMPDAIIADVDLDHVSLNDLLNTLKNSARFRAVPLFLYSENLDKQLLNKFYTISLVDDIYSKTSDVKEIVSRIEFLSSYKKQINNYKSDDCVTVVNNNYKFELNYFLKRVEDILISGTLLILLSPLFFIIAIAISFESRGPVVYTSKRAGRGFRIFAFYKFRSMFTDSDTHIENLKHLNQYENEEGNNAGFFKISNDPRVTRVGAFLRNTSLDELPQLYNVLIGDMSVVGNRPLPLYEAHTITTDSWSKRFLAPAGLTGLWQVEKRGKKDMSAAERLNLDISYANKWSFVSDMSIMIKTPKALIQRDNV